MRKVIALALALALQAGAVGTPLMHAHPDEHATAHHRGRDAHVHWAGHHAPPAPHHRSWTDRADHDRAIYAGTLVAVSSASFSVPVVVTASFALAPAATRTTCRRIDVVRSHDPPFTPSLGSRAPPALLS